MRYLNNVNQNNMSHYSGFIIKINKIKESGIYYTLFENSFLASQNKFGIDKNVEMYNKSLPINKGLFTGDTINETDIENYLALLKVQSVETEFVLSDDSRNWYILTGSTGLETKLRLFIPNKAYDNALKGKDDLNHFYYPLWQIISFGTENINSNFSQITDNSIVLYLEELLNTHKAIIDLYVNDGVIIENKEIINPLI